MTKLIAVFLLLFALAASAAPEVPFQIIVNADNPVSSLTREQVGRLFLKKVTTWSGGGVVAPVDLPSGSELRRAFCETVLEKSPAALESYWQQRIFSGQDVPPREKPDDQAVIDFVRGNRNAIGYISSRTNPTGVKVITLTD